MEYDPEKPEDLASWLNTYLDGYWQSYASYWEIGSHTEEGQFEEEQRAFHTKLDALGPLVRKVVHTLDATSAREAIGEILPGLTDLDRLTDSDIAEFVRLFHSIDIVRDSVRIQLAFEAVDTLLPQAEDRAAQLVALVGSRSLSETASAYLDRATRLFLWGFDPECVIMCRSVLEAALLSRLSEHLDPDRPPPSLDTMLKIAGERGLLAGYERWSSRRGWRARRGSPLWHADRIRWAGNRLVHDMPVLDSPDGTGVSGGLEAVAELAAVLDELFS